MRAADTQLDIVCGTGLYRLGGTFLGLNLAGESDEDREVRLQALRTKKAWLSTTGTCGECVSDCCEFHSDFFLLT